MSPQEFEQKYAINCEDAIAFIAESRTGFAIVDNAGVFQYVNKAYCQILDAAAERIIGTHFKDWTHADDVEIDLKLASEVASGKIPSYTLNKRYLKQGLYNGKRREVWGLLLVEGQFSQNELEYYRVQFRAYEDITNRPPIQWREMLTWAFENWKLVGTVLALMVVSIFGSSENLLTLLKVLTGSDGGNVSP